MSRKHITLRLDVDVLKKIEDYAASVGRNRNNAIEWVLREKVAEYTTRKNKPAEPENQMERLDKLMREHPEFDAALKDFIDARETA